MQTIIYGKKGEALACDYLKKKKYKILAKNYKNEIGEIDIIAKDKKCLVFVEVKARTSDQFGDPAEAVDEKKQWKIRQVATKYLKANRLLDSAFRFDVIAVYGDTKDAEIRHIDNAF